MDVDYRDRDVPTSLVKEDEEGTHTGDWDTPGRSTDWSVDCEVAGHTQTCLHEGLPVRPLGKFRGVGVSTWERITVYRCYTPSETVPRVLY